VYTILHLSDLHRSRAEPFDNDTILAALLSDRDRYLLESPAVGRPDAAIISGDIIQGVPLGTVDYAAELTRQYDVAHDFLARLADRFFDGDRSRIVIVPGNHDVCWNTSFSAMERLGETDRPEKIGPWLFRPGSPYRWRWDDCSVYKIAQPQLYDQRLAQYLAFLKRFYAETPLKYAINDEQGFNFFELDHGRILVAALESVHGNDCFCQHGAIKDGLIGKCTLALRDVAPQPLLGVAVWHHSIQGPPSRDDYMDVSSVHEMIGGGFRLGLHGHQHQADAGAYNIHLPQALSMGVASAGSLCAGAKELPRGTNRQYNVIVISDDYTSAKVHVREMAQGNQFGRSRQGVFAPDGFVEVSWALPANGSPRERNVSMFNKEAVLVAEDALKNGEAEAALTLLGPVERRAGSHARHLYVSAARQAKRWNLVADCLFPPTNVGEFMELFNALCELKDFIAAETLIADASKYGLDAATKAELKSKLALLTMWGKN
jgi:hypothetical protein